MTPHWMPQAMNSLRCSGFPCAVASRRNGPPPYEPKSLGNARSPWPPGPRRLVAAPPSADLLATRISRCSTSPAAAHRTAFLSTAAPVSLIATISSHLAQNNTYFYVFGQTSSDDNVGKVGIRHVYGIREVLLVKVRSIALQAVAAAAVVLLALPASALAQPGSSSAVTAGARPNPPAAPPSRTTCAAATSSTPERCIQVQRSLVSALSPSQRAEMVSSVPGHAAKAKADQANAGGCVTSLAARRVHCELDNRRPG